MELKAGLSALVTGAASGIGKALCLALAEKGIFVTIVDFSEEKAKEVASLAATKIAKFHPGLNFPAAIWVKCDVRDNRDLAASFEKHLATYGGLDICINCAGISNAVPFHKDDTDGTTSWRRCIDVNLVAVVQCTRLAIKTMQGKQKPGVIINLGSASGLYPMPMDAIYSATKAGVVLFTRSLAHLKRSGIRINVLCPEFIETDMGVKVASIVDGLGGFIPMEKVVQGAFELITNESKAGSCLWITNRRGLEYWPTPSEEAKYRMADSNSTKRVSYRANFNFQLPQSFEKIVVHTLSHNFRNATRIVRAPLRLPVEPNKVLLKIIYAGVNASDACSLLQSPYAVQNVRIPTKTREITTVVINGLNNVNFSSGRYFSSNNSKAGGPSLPFDAGFEAVGLIAAVGDSVRGLEVGSPAAIMTFGSYAEFTIVDAKHIIPVARPDAEVVAMLTSGLTASIALEKSGQMGSGQTVLVTAAAGGTGQFAVQLAKLAGNKVVATCGGKEKAMLLKELGVDRVIDYKAEDIKTVLKKEFPKGVDIIYESVGGDMFDTCLNALAVYGRLIVIGMISQYQGEHGWQPSNYTGLCEKILAKSQTVAGFFLVQYGHLWKQHLDKVYHLYSIGKLKVAIDQKKFSGLQAVPDAVEHLHSGKSTGKVVVCMDPTFEQQKAKL